MGIQYLDIKGDGKLVINQMTGVYALKERTLAPYRAEAQHILRHFGETALNWENREPPRRCLSNFGIEAQDERGLSKHKSCQENGSSHLASTK